VQVGALRDARQAAGELLEAQARKVQEVGAVSAALTEQLDSAESLHAAGEGLLSEFIAQAKRLEASLAELRTKGAELEERLSAALAGPNEAIATAKAQAGQLEQVCAVVRKVFAGLSKASLEAQQQAAALDQAGGLARQQLQALTSDTDQASQTVREWIEEAVRVQTRLERALSQCPSIAETHSGAGLRALLRHRTEAQPPCPADPAGDDSDVNDGAVGEHPAEPQPGRRRSPAAREIARLIEDAKSVASSCR